jgi:hypothetical protein
MCVSVYLTFKRHNIDSSQCNSLFNTCSLISPTASNKRSLCHKTLTVSLIQQNFEAIEVAFLEAGD